MERVNKVSVYIEDKSDPAIITLYRTNTKLCEFDNNCLGIPNLDKSNVDRSTYQQYCKDVVINLLENGGIEGYYYKQKVNQPSINKKFSKIEFRAECINRLSDILNMIIDGTEISYNINRFKVDSINVISLYKDNNIKYGTTDIAIDMEDKKKETIIVRMEIKSGQICKPKTFVTSDGKEKPLNITTITKMLK